MEADDFREPRTPRNRPTQRALPDHYSPVTDAVPSPDLNIVHRRDLTHYDAAHNQQVMSPRAPHSNPAGVTESPSPLQTATLVQATRLEIPTSILQQFAQAASLDATLLHDIRAAVVELNDRMQYRSNILGDACVTLHSGYNAMVDNLDRLQQGMEAHSRTLACLMNENQSLKQQIDSTREQLTQSRRKPRLQCWAKQWQAQVEAHIVTIQNNLDAGFRKASSEKDDLQTRLTLLEQACKRNDGRLDDLVQKGLGEHDGAVMPEVRAEMDTLGTTVCEHMQRLDEMFQDVAGLHASVATMSDRQAAMEQNLEVLHQTWEAYALHSDLLEGENIVDEAGINEYEAEWWAADPCMPRGHQTENLDTAAGPQPAEHPPGLEVQQDGSRELPSAAEPKPEHGSVASVTAGAIPLGRWKLLQDVPLLNLGSGEPWELGMRLRTWIKQVETISSTIAGSFGDYVKNQFQIADQRHQRRSSGLVSLEALREVPLADLENENRLVLLLIRWIPSELKQGVLEKNDESEPIRAVDLLEGVLETLQPGGAAEMQSLNAFVRSLQPASTAKEALSTLRRWRLARTRATSLSLPQVAPYEELKALETLVRNLERRHDRFRTMLGLLRTQPDIIRPTVTGVESMVALIDQQLQLLSADEHVKNNRQNEPDSQAAKGKGGGKGKGDGKGNGGSAATKPCPFLKKFGSCKFGEKCKFKHEGEAAAKQASASSSQAQAPLVGAQPNPKASAARVKSHVPMARSSGYADSAEAEEESSAAPSSTEEEMPMHAEASTPEWSDVLDLSVRDYVAWTHRRTGQYVDDEGRGPPEIQSFADSAFYTEPNPRSVTWAVWFTVIHDQLDEDDSGVIPVADGVDMIKLDAALVQCADGIPRPVFVAWVVDLKTGRERRFAVARITQQPIVREWPRPPPNVAAPPRATNSTVPWAEMRATSRAVPHVTQAHHPPVSACLHRRPTSVQQPESLYLEGTDGAHQKPLAAAAVGSALGHAGGDDLVLADTGANEVIRPTGNGPPPRSSSVSLTLADGNEVEAWRTRDGELAIPGSDAWIAPIGKIVALGYRFVWDPITGAQLKRDDGEDETTYHLCIENGLPYLAWSDFVEIRKQLSQAHKVRKRSMCAHVESPAEPRYVTLEDFVACEAEHRAQEEPVGHIGERDITFAPHRDLGNENDTQNILVVLNHQRAVNWQKYHLLSYEEAQLGNEIEARLLEASTAPAQAETVDLKGFYTGDRQENWKASLVKDYGKMNGVLEEVLRTQLREKLGIDESKPLPREIPSKIVATLKPCDNPAEANADGFLEKSRLCARGNCEAGVDNNGEPWSSSNIPLEIVRTFVSLAASNDAWTLGGLDVEEGFLKVDISSGDPVILSPPKVMRDLNMVSPNTVWIARKNIYGLRRGPTEWQKERDTKLNHAVIEPTSSDGLSALTLVPLNLAAGLWKVVDSRGAVVGACCCYVDDGLVLGCVEVIRGVTAYIQGLWAIKGQGILAKPSVNLTEDVKISDTLTLKLVQCMRFLGAEISASETGLQIGQAKYGAQELRARGWLALKGSESLPVPSEGLAGSELRDSNFQRNMKLARKEAGTLMWAACLGIASTLITVRPTESLRLCKGIWRYLRGTWDKYGYKESEGSEANGDDQWVFRIVSDASLAPGGAR
ncbi:unnamed protein product [Symbiodinium sp. CCMP2592]|nr:unnamed protein product [Symbiodinium sp. CCMP2592]